MRIPDTQHYRKIQLENRVTSRAMKCLIESCGESCRELGQIYWQVLNTFRALN